MSNGNIPVYGTGGYMLSVNKALSHTDSIGLGRKGTIDKPQFLKAPFWTVDTLFFLTPKEKYSIHFLYPIIQKFNWKKLNEATGVPSLSKKTIENQKEYFPNIDEQNQLGTLIDYVTKTITLQQRQLDLYERLKKGLLQKLFPKDGEKVPEVRFTDFHDDWEQHKLGELGKIQSGVGFPEMEQGGTSGIPFFKISDMNNKGNEYEMITANNYVSKEQIIRKRWNPINVPAVIFAKVGAAIMLNRKRLVFSSFLIDNNTMAYIFDNSWSASFGKTLFDNINLPRYAQVGALPSYNGTDIKDIKITIPDKKEQIQMDKLFSYLNKTITLQKDEMNESKALKKYLLQKLFI